METSKKIALFSGFCFALVLLFSIGMFLYGTFTSSEFDYTMLITLDSVTGAMFGTTCAFYYNKSRHENCYKIRKSFLREKYDILKEMGMLDYDRAQSELDEEFTKIENDFDNEDMMSSQEITHEQ